MTADAPDTNLLLADAYEGLEDASVYVKDLDGRYLMINAAGAAVMGLEPDQLVGKTDEEACPANGASIREVDEAVIANDASHTYEDVLDAGGGEVRAFLTTKAPLRDASGSVIGLIGISTDITRRKTDEDQLRRREAALAEAQAVSGVGSWDTDLVRGVRHWSDELYRIFGVDPETFEPTFESIRALIHPDDHERVDAAFDLSRHTGADFELEYRIVRPDGQVRTVIARARVFKDLDGEPVRMVGAALDITERKAGFQQLERDLQGARSRPLRDPLTQLANRTLAHDRLEHAFDLAKLGGSDLSVALIDIDGFTDLNQRHGQLLGDSVLVLVAERLRSCTRESDTLARVGGDEFLVLCEEVEIAPGTLPTSENLRQAFAEPLELERTGDTIEITFSMGSSSIGDRSVPRARQLLEEAEEALTRARGRGPGGYAQHSGDAAETNGHRPGPSISQLNADPPRPSGDSPERSAAEELVRHMYEVWGPGERDDWMACFHKDVEYTPSAGLSGFDPIYRGREGMRRFWEHIQQGWESIEVVPLHFEERGDNFVVFVLASLVLRGSGAKIEVSLHQGGTMRDGLVYRLGGYESRTEAFQALEARD